MHSIELDSWLSRFTREIGIKSSVIVYGNTSDLVLNRFNNGRYESTLNTLVCALRDKGYEKVVKWDRVEGVSGDSVDTNDAACSNSPGGQAYDMGGGSPSRPKQAKDKYKAPEEFFPYMNGLLKKGCSKTAFILDFSDYIFGNANSLSEQERQHLATLGKAIQSGQTYNLVSDVFNEVGNIIVIVAHNNATIPPAYYMNNPMVSSINVPLPGRSEREYFIKSNLSCLKVKENLDQKSELDDFVDSLDGYSLVEIAQIMKLSKQMDETMSVDKLINLYKYGEKVSPWEELSKEKLETIEERLKERVKGQDAAVAKVKDVIIRAYTGFAGLQHSAKQKKPKGTLFFVGPTGVGKTELAKALAEFVFGDETACIRFDMSEYNHEHSDQRLVGAPPGYVGFEAGGQLTNAIKEKPFCVILFDEIEKAHGKILDKFLQILEDGRLTDGKGETVYFSEAIIIFTSNIGATKVSSDLPKKEVKKQFIAEVQNHFINELGRPELLNRIGDNIVAFNFIDDPEVYSKIAEVKFKVIADFVKDKYQATLSFRDKDAAFKAIADHAGINNGGRGLLNTLESDIVNPLSEFIFEKTGLLSGRTIYINQVLPEKPIFEFELE